MRTLARSLAPFLTVYLFLVTVGLPLQKVYCACQGVEFLSFWDVPHECHHAAKEAKPAVHQHASACCKLSQEKSSCDLKVADDHNCGTSEIIFAQLDVDFFSNLESGRVLNVLITLPPFSPYLAPDLAKVRIPKSVPIRGPTPPGWVTGRDILVRHQVFLC